ncbi:ABC transporter permease [Acidiferrimicrobium sp. IK]|uniref:ABC transporter permease n=1 Tax=Acidiferrimicrobium sp. IK TaxID=2871700 RepID=UPI0021CAEEAD|nr:ABC transporter permease [Acidiferrimicrobium sp. IK]MCU4185290.1 ABC transporter permease [Acidiferrimicrobium sp. IK]
MTLASGAWPTFAADRPADDRPAAGGRQRGGSAVVWRAEMTKMAGQWRVRAAALACAVAPFAVLMAFNVQGATPSDTLFGQWIHTSGWAVPMVVLLWSGQWLLPALTAIVAGDIFSAEDHLGTWKTVLTRSRSRGQVFTGKLLAAASFAVVMVVIVGGASMLAGLAGGSRPLVGLTGQTVPAGHAAWLAALSWSTQLPPILAFTGLAVLLSVWTRNSVVGIGAPVLLGLVLQLVSMVDMPLALRHWLINTPFGAWIGLWTQPRFVGPVGQGAATSGLWLAVTVAAAWAVFRRRAIGAA